MISHDVDYNLLKNIFNEYKENYFPIINTFTHNIVIFNNNKILGFVIYSEIYENCEIIDVFVKEKYRKNGYASKMLSEVIEKNKNRSITLEVNSTNVPALELYNKLGFEKVAIRKGYYNGVDAYLMRKK